MKEVMTLSISTSLLVYLLLNTIVILFQIALMVGMPWGSASMGGKFPGVYPKKMRIIAGVNVLVIFVFSLIVLTRSGLIFTNLMELSRILIWVVVLFCTAGTILNTITPSRIERIWAPVAAAQLLTGIIIALS